MAKIKNLLISGSLEDLTFYVMDGKGYVKMKSRITGKMVKTQKRYKGTMKSAGELDKGSRLASKAYRVLDPNVKKHFMYRKMTGIAKKGYRDGLSEEEIQDQFRVYLAEVMNVGKGNSNEE